MMTMNDKKNVMKKKKEERRQQLFSYSNERDFSLCSLSDRNAHYGGRIKYIDFFFSYYYGDDEQINDETWQGKLFTTNRLPSVTPLYVYRKNSFLSLKIFQCHKAITFSYLFVEVSPTRNSSQKSHHQVFLNHVFCTRTTFPVAIADRPFLPSISALSSTSESFFSHRCSLILLYKSLSFLHFTNINGNKNRTTIKINFFINIKSCTQPILVPHPSPGRQTVQKCIVFVHILRFRK